MTSLKLYYSSVSSSQEIKKKQQKIEMILSSKKFDFVKVDIATDTDKRTEMRSIVGNDKALPPQLCRGSDYIGDFDAFDNAVESETLNEFLRL